MAIWKKEKDEGPPKNRPDPVTPGSSRAAETGPSAREDGETPPPAPSKTSNVQGARHEMKEETTMANIGKSISIKGDVLGDEDTVIEGRVEGRVSLKNHHLTIGSNGDVQGEVSAKQITIVGKVAGNVIASERVEVRDSGRVEGDVLAPRLLVTEGALINGAITMKEVSSGKPQQPAQPQHQPNQTQHH